MLSEPPAPHPSTHHGRLCWVTRWYGEPDPATGKRPQYAERWYDLTQAQAHAQYGAWLSRWRNDPEMQDPRRARDVSTVADLAKAYLRHVEQTYRKDGQPTSHFWNAQTALQVLIDHHGDLRARDLSAPMFAKLRDACVLDDAGQPRNRATVNKWLSIIRSAYRWAVERGDVDQSVWLGLGAVALLHKGRSLAREAGKVGPVAWATLSRRYPTSPAPSPRWCGPCGIRG